MRTSIRGLLAATLLAGTALAATPAFAEEETAPPSDFTITGSAQLVTDYRFRGLSLTAGDPAIQASIGASHSSGFYVGIWGSNLEDTPLYGNMELDIYGGWTGALGGGFTADVGVLYYLYPNNHSGFPADVWEPYASVSKTFGPATAKLGVAYAWTQESLGDEDNLYVYFDLSAGIPGTPVTVTGHIGYTDGALSPKRLTFTSMDGGFDYSLGASFAVTKNLSIGATYIGVDGDSYSDFSNDTVVGTLKVSF